MGQQPNIELEISDLPRPTPGPAPARRWSPRRPGELGAPDDVPWGGMFGTAGPDTGFAFVLLRQYQVTPGPGEHPPDVEAALAALAGARASRVGRGPTRQDIEVAMLLLGYDPAGVPAAVLEPLIDRRSGWISNLAHAPAKARALVASFDPAVLEATVDEIRSRMVAGEYLVGR